MINAVINGQGTIQQRPAVAATGTYSFAGDKFAGALTGTAATGTFNTVSNATIGTGHAHACTGITTTGSGVVAFRTRIEAADSARFINQYGTFSCLVQHDIGANVAFTVYLRTATGPDNFASVTDIGNSGPINVLSSQLLTFTTLMGTCGNGIEIEIKAAVGAVTSKNVYLTNVQLEQGASVSPFETRPYGAELALCQRYCQKLGTQSAGGNPIGNGYAYGATRATQSAGIQVVIKLLAPMRDTPTIDSSSNVVTTPANIVVADYISNIHSLTACSLGSSSDRTSLTFNGTITASSAILAGDTIVAWANTGAVFIVTADL